MLQIQLTINGRPLEDWVREDEMLLPFLRRHGYKSVKYGCETSNCGLCSVLVNGKPVLSCSTPLFRLQNAAVETLEGLEEEAAPMRPYLAKQAADQCGFCNPGYLVMAVALAREYENPDERTILDYLAGNLCRCSGYLSQTRGLLEYFSSRQKNKTDSQTKEASNE